MVLSMICSYMLKCGRLIWMLMLLNVVGGGQQGFQADRVRDSFIVDGMGAMGTVQSERNLTYYEVSLSGHMIPQFVPKVCWCGFLVVYCLLTGCFIGCLSKFGISYGYEGYSVNA